MTKDVFDLSGGKSIDDLIPDIYKLLLDTKGHKVSQENLDKFAVNVANHLKNALEESQRDESRVLRMSSIGKKPRQLWYEAQQAKVQGGTKIVRFSGAKLISFLYGNIIEELVIFLAREAGHSVTDEQKEVLLEGISGKLDCYIDGKLTDIKSASFRSFDKFKNGSLLDGNDDFGYVDQISGYSQAEAQTSAAFLSMNKETGELGLLKLNDLDLKDVVPQIKELKIALEKQTPPPKCYEDVAEGTSGNRGLCKNCQWCPFKMDCWKDANNGRGLQVYRYSNGVKFLTHISREPAVPNITEGFTSGKES